jgi:hypothetical protein
MIAGTQGRKPALNQEKWQPPVLPIFTFWCYGMDFINLQL